MTQDALTVLNDIPFSIPPYFALLARAIVTLEGVALSGRDGFVLMSWTALFDFVGAVRQSSVWDSDRVVSFCGQEAVEGRSSRHPEGPSAAPLQSARYHKSDNNYLNHKFMYPKLLSFILFLTIVPFSDCLWLWNRVRR